MNNSILKIALCSSIISSAFAYDLKHNYPDKPKSLSVKEISFQVRNKDCNDLKDASLSNPDKYSEMKILFESLEGETYISSREGGYINFQNVLLEENGDVVLGGKVLANLDPEVLRETAVKACQRALDKYPNDHVNSQIGFDEKRGLEKNEISLKYQETNPTGWGSCKKIENNYGNGFQGAKYKFYTKKLNIDNSTTVKGKIVLRKGCDPRGGAEAASDYFSGLRLKFKAVGRILFDRENLFAD